VRELEVQISDTVTVLLPVARSKLADFRAALVELNTLWADVERLDTGVTLAKYWDKVEFIFAMLPMKGTALGGLSVAHALESDYHQLEEILFCQGGESVHGWQYGALLNNLENYKGGKLVSLHCLSPMKFISDVNNGFRTNAEPAPTETETTEV
jgi:hypothetical protein